MEQTGDVMRNFKHNESTLHLGNHLVCTLGTIRGMEESDWLLYQCWRNWERTAPAATWL